MDRLRELEVFSAVVEAGSLAKAAARLRISPPAVTRTVASLEARLGVRLLQRTTRSSSLTEAGARYLASTRRLLAELEAAAREAAGETATPAGHLRVTASVAFGRATLAPILRAFLRRERGVSAALLLLDRVVDLVEEGIDVAVRIGRLPDSSLVARRVGEVRRVLVASPRYLAKHGRPKAPADLRRHTLIGFTGLAPTHEWRLGASRVAVAPRFEVNDASVALAAAEAGEGITVALSYMVGAALARRRLACVLEGFLPPPVPVQLVYPAARHLAPKLRAFVDFTAPRLAEALAPRRAAQPTRKPA